VQFDAPPAPDVGPDAWRTAVTLTRAGGYSVAAGQGIFLKHFKDASPRDDAFAILYPLFLKVDSTPPW